MSADPNQMAQMLAMYKSQFPTQAGLGMGNAPAGTTAGAGAANGLSKLMLALMQQKANQQYKLKYPQQQAAPVPNTTPPVPSQGISPAAPPMGGGVGP